MFSRNVCPRWDAIRSSGCWREVADQLVADVEAASQKTRRCPIRESSRAEEEG